MARTCLVRMGGAAIFIDEGKNLFIRLPKENRSRPIGRLHCKDGVTSWYKDEKEEERFRRTNAWSLPFELLRYIDGTINFRTEKAVYRISKEDALKYGKFLFFKQKGIEKKIYVPIFHWAEEAVFNS